jgi:hypothetical protein
MPTKKGRIAASLTQCASFDMAHQDRAVAVAVPDAARTRAARDPDFVADRTPRHRKSLRPRLPAARIPNRLWRNNVALNAARPGHAMSCTQLACRTLRQMEY